MKRDVLIEAVWLGGGWGYDFDEFLTGLLEDFERRVGVDVDLTASLAKRTASFLAMGTDMPVPDLLNHFRAACGSNQPVPPVRVSLQDDAVPAAGLYSEAV